MEIPLRRLGSNPGHEEWQLLKPGDPTKEPLYQGAEISQKSASLRSHKSSLGAQGRGFDPHGRRSFFGPFLASNLAIMMTTSCAYSALVASKSL